MQFFQSLLAHSLQVSLHGCHFKNYMRGGRTTFSVRDRVWNILQDCANRAQNRKIILHNKNCCAGLCLNFFHRHKIHPQIFLHFRGSPWIFFLCKILRNQSVSRSWKRIANLFKHLWENIVNFVKDWGNKKTIFIKRSRNKIKFVRRPQKKIVNFVKRLHEKSQI